jgi:hypothetical protein
MPRRRHEFEPGEVGAEAVKLEKFSDAGGSQIQRLSDVGRFTLFEREQYTTIGAIEVRSVKNKRHAETFHPYRSSRQFKAWVQSDSSQTNHRILP